MFPRDQEVHLGHGPLPWGWSHCEPAHWFCLKRQALAFL